MYDKNIKNFVECYADMKEAYRSFKLNKDYARTFLARVREHLTPEEYAVMRARLSMDITHNPLSMVQIAKTLEANGIKDSEVTRQRVEQIIKKTLKKLEKIQAQKQLQYDQREK